MFSYCKMLGSIVAFVNLVTLAHGAKILGYFPTPSYSHQIVYQSILRELSLRGHQVTVITPNPLKDSSLVNLTEIDVSFVYKAITNGKIQRKLSQEVPLPTRLLWIYTQITSVHDKTLEAAKHIIEDNTIRFDLILSEFFFGIFNGFACRYKAPIIGVASSSLYPVGHDFVGNPTHPLMHSDVYLPLGETRTFSQKVQSVLYQMSFRVFFHWHVLPKNDKIVKTHFGHNCPCLGNLQRETSLVLVSSNILLHLARPNVPAVVELHGTHLHAKKELPQDLQEYLDNSPQGVVYFSLGSNVKSVNLTENVRQVILEALSELPYNVLWKWESDHLPGKPDNVMTRQWLPQQDLLGHKNIKVFVTQGGLQSMEEAIANGVPLVGMPFFADQPLNVMKMVKLGIGVGLDYATMTKDELKNAILEVAQNNKYKEKINELRDLLQDQPMSGLDKAIWWIEYVIRHKGAKHLRSPAVDMPWWEYYLLDVIAFLLACFIVIMYINYLILRLIWRRIFRRNSQKTKVN